MDDTPQVDTPPPQVAEAAGSIVRSVLNLVAGLLVANGIWSEDAAKSYVAGAAVWIVAMAWGVYQKSAARRKLRIALGLEQGATEAEVNAVAAQP